MKCPAYPKYKDSGVQWLGEVPEHWEVKRLSYLALLKSGESITSEQIAEGGDYPVYGGNGLRGNYSAYTHEGSFVLIGRQGALCGNINYATGRFWASEHAVVVNPLETIATRWLGELLYAMNLNQYSVSAAQPGLSVSQIGSLKIPVPPLPEQTVIADFLDRETGRIETLVAKKRRLITLLGEKRTALISRTVTRGLPADAAREFGLELHTHFKDSGIEWLGEVPEGWEVVPAKYLCDAIVDCKNRTPDYFDDGDYFVVRTTDVKSGAINFASMLKTDAENYSTWTQRGAPIKGDVLFTREAPAGEAAIYEGDKKICLGQRMMYFRANKSRLTSLFLKFWIYSDVARGYIDSSSGGSTVTHLRVGQVLNFPVAEVPLPEQTAIATYLDRETAKIDQLVTKVEAAIARLQEYRTALITAAVTGKIDVREVV
jgi:type I restriction enzyme S subunit